MLVLQTVWLLILINCVSIFGFATFCRNPHLIVQYPWSVPIFVDSFSFFAQVQIACSFLVIMRASLKSLGQVTYRLLMSAFAIGFSMELWSTSFGIPFGKYSYTDLLGWKILGKVPFWIPISWFCMSLASWLLAHQILGKNRPIFFKILLGAVLLLTWDFTLDPAMSQLTPFWLWDQSQNFILHMPIRNLGGWFLTGCLIMASYHFQLPSLAERWRNKTFPLKYYLANLLLPMGFAVVARLWLPILGTALIGSICFFLIKILGSSRNFRTIT